MGLSKQPFWVCPVHGREALSLDVPRIMGILNVTPDSFSDGGQSFSLTEAMDRARKLIAEGADILDIGGESTRPGAQSVEPGEQIRRVVPVIAGIRASNWGKRVLISVDTTIAEVAEQAIRAGTDIINDVSGGIDDPDMFSIVAREQAGMVIMHRLLKPAQDVYSDQRENGKGSSINEVREHLDRLVKRAAAAGIAPERLVLDPGLGFGKSVEENLALIVRTRELSEKFPVLSGLSRKSFTAKAAGMSMELPATDRLEATLALSVLHLLKGAMIFRVHDVRAHVLALRATWAGMQHLT